MILAWKSDKRMHVKQKKRNLKQTLQLFLQTVENGRIGADHVRCYYCRAPDENNEKHIQPTPEDDVSVK